MIPANASCQTPDEASITEYKRTPSHARYDLRGVLILSILMLVAAVARVSNAPLDSHGDVDYFFREWALFAVRTSPWVVYRYTAINYPPLSIYLYAAAANPYEALGGDLGMFPVPLTWAVLKIPAIVFDMIMMVVGYWTAWRTAGVVPGLIVAALLGANPVIFYDSAVWGQIDAVFTTFLMLSLMALHCRRVTMAWILFALSLLTKLQAVVLLPALITFTVWPRLDSGHQKHYLFGSIAGWRALGKGLIGALLVFVIVMLPFYVGSSTAAFRGYLQIDQQPFITVNAFNFWYWATNGYGNAGAVGQDGRLLYQFDSKPLAGLPFNPKTLGLILLGAATALYLIRAITQPHCRNDFLIAGCFYIAFFMLPTQIHERYLYPAIPLLTLAICRPVQNGRVRVDWRAIILLAGVTFTGLYNITAAHHPFVGLHMALWRALGDGASIGAVLNTNLVLFFLSVAFVMWPDRAGLHVRLVATFAHLAAELNTQTRRLRDTAARVARRL